MSDLSSIESDFLKKVSEIIEENISNEKFGVSELANEMAMSRSNLLRKIKKLTNLSVSQFIRQVRLRHAMEMLKNDSLSTSEVAYRVGFSSVSYFIKCFREFYGYPPGEAVKQEESVEESQQTTTPDKKSRNILITVISILALIAVLYLILKPSPEVKPKQEKSIAVLPFQNDSNDSSNVYIINGLMESLLNKLQKIEGLRVISRTSVEKYRNNPKTSAEIAKELNVAYFVEGSGQKIGDQIMLNIQLIEATNDKHLWAEQYNREAKDIFNLQKELAINIVDKIEVLITPEEKERLNEQSTENLLAYDFFLKGLDLMQKGNKEGFEEAINYFNRAIDEDPNYARAYASISMSYYFLDLFQADKKHLNQISHYADKAFLLDAKLPQALIAKALSYNIKGEKDIAITYLEKALEYKPNSALVINFLSDYYANQKPNTEKYLQYALKGMQLDINAQDSISTSFMYLHLSNAFIQSGFTNEAETYINQSLLYKSDNIFSQYVKAYILYAKNKDLNQTRELLVSTLKKDTSRLDVLQEVGKIYCYQRDYKTAYAYYKRFIDAREKYKLDIFAYENVRIALVLDKMGFKEEATKYLEAFRAYSESSESIYKNLSLSMYYAYKDNAEKAIKHLKLFSEQDYYHIWTVLFLDIDPLIDNMKDEAEFQKILDKLKSKFWKRHKRLRKSLDKKGLLHQ